MPFVLDAPMAARWAFDDEGLLLWRSRFSGSAPTRRAFRVCRGTKGAPALEAPLNEGSAADHLHANYIDLFPEKYRNRSPTRQLLRINLSRTTKILQCAQDCSTMGGSKLFRRYNCHDL
jgi:hypothetical protein